MVVQKWCLGFLLPPLPLVTKLSIVRVCYIDSHPPPFLPPKNKCHLWTTHSTISLENVFNSREKGKMKNFLKHKKKKFLPFLFLDFQQANFFILSKQTITSFSTEKRKTWVVSFQCYQFWNAYLLDYWLHSVKNEKESFYRDLEKENLRAFEPNNWKDLANIVDCDLQNCESLLDHY